MLNNLNKGMFLETIINRTIDYYRKEGIALFEKRHLKIDIFQTFRVNNKIQVNGWLKEKSTTDYFGVYKSLFIDFEAKETNSKTSFSLQNIKEHQLEHLKSVIDHKGKSFLIIYFKKLDIFYLLWTKDLLSLWNNEKRSIDINYFEQNCSKIKIIYPGILNLIDLI